MGQQYLSTDPNAGDPLRPQAQGPNATEQFFGSHRPITETGEPLDAPGFLDRYVNPALRSAARPESLTDVMNLLIPGQIPKLGLVGDAAGAAARGVGRMATKGAAMIGDLVSPDVVGMISPRAGNALRLAQKIRASMKGNAPQVAAPRLAGKAPSLEDALTGAVNEVRQTPTPQAVSLPGGNAVRASTPVPKVEPSGSRMGAYSSQPTPAPPVSPRETPSGAPPAARVPARAQSAPPRATRPESVRLTPEESQAMQALVAEGYDEADVVQAIVRERQAAPPVSSPTKPATGKASLSAAETKEYQRLLSRGKSPQQAMQLIESQRKFQQVQGLPTSEQTRVAVRDRNESGRWPD